MKMASLNEMLEIEKEKLNRLADEALKNGIPLTQDDAFMEQNRKIDALIFNIQMEKEMHRKKKPK
ncbi:hypothetical protein [Desulforamulus aquiferis]|uniref:Aspartyl-phosphate phosphatase Spo0E family protein n=1 Tax=Desulforamulus aquiferis TaxID=1397668 RepID=A0AAW7ZFM0_9FIRM|nr:hypothetical protein [Desulforamulus aquiferis]MDO7788157.1 hypothetical protein [Desulforamulus aquiferis]